MMPLFCNYGKCGAPPFFAITPGSNLTQCACICWDPIYEQPSRLGL